MAPTISILPEVLFTLTLVPSKFSALTFSEAMTLIFPTDVVLPISIFPRLRGEVRLEGGRLRGSSRGEGVELPASLQGFEDLKLSHPYYWSAFVMIGSPW